MWNLGQVNDWPGAGGLLSDLFNQAKWGLSASIVWCLVFSWYAILPFSRTTSTNVGLGHALTTAAEPWSGHWEVSPQIFALAHHNQFSAPGWRYLSNTSGFGALPGGGSWLVRFDPAAPAGPLAFSVVASNVGGAAAALPFALANVPAPFARPAVLEVWITTQAAGMVRAADVPIAADGTFTLAVPADAMLSATSAPAGPGGRGPPAPKAPIPPSAPFPFPYSDDFSGYAAEGYAKYFSDEGGLFIIRPDAGAAGGPALCNIIDTVPIVWEKNPDPYTLIGNMNANPSLATWTDYTVTVRASFKAPVPPPAPLPPAGPHLTLQACGGGAAQALRVVSASGDLSTPASLVSAAGLCVGIDGADPVTAGARAAALVPCNATGASTAALKFLAGPGAAQISSTGGAHAGLCLDVDGGVAAVGARVVGWPCKADGSANEKWTVLAAPGGAVTLASQASSPALCVDSSGAPPAPPAPPAAPPAYLMLAARIASYKRNGAPPAGYTFVLNASPNATAAGDWALSFAGGAPIARGSAGKPVVPGVAYTLAMRLAGADVSVWLDGVRLGGATDASGAAGMVAFGSGWHGSCFEAFAVANNTAA